MKKLSRAYLVITAFAAVGCVFLLFDRGEYDVATSFRNAVECPDASSDHCYQLYPGVIRAVHVDQTSSGQEDRVDIDSAGTTIHVALRPAAGDASLIQAGAPVTVEWYVGSVATVLIGGRAIPSVSSPTTHANFAYIGWALVWLAALFWAVLLVDRRVMALFAAVRILPAAAQVQALASREVILPGGTTGWVVKPRPQQTLLLPFLLAALALISVRPLMSSGSRPLAVLGDILLFGPLIVRFALTLRNGRIMGDQSSMTRVSWLGRARTWPLSDIELAAVLGVRWSDWAVPAIWFIDGDENFLFGASSLYWNLDEIGALCVKLGVPIEDYVPIRPRRRSLARLAVSFAALLITGAFLVYSFLPLPPSNT